MAWAVADAGMGDEAVQATNDDATLCKLSAVRAGYWTDPHLPALVRQAGHRRDPEIHLGYYARVAGVRALVGKFCEAADTAVQVLSLGAGFDTTYWRMLGEGRALHNYIEVISLLDLFLNSKTANIETIDCTYCIR